MQLQDQALGNQDIKTFLETGKTFDIVVVSVMGSEGGYYLAKKFKSSLVLYSTGQASIPWFDHAMGQPHNPSYMPLALLESGSDMSFTERLKNLLLTTFMHTMRDYYLLPKVERLLDTHFPGEVRPSLLDMEKNATAAFGFTHPMFLDGWRPTNPNYVHLGMMNCR